MIKKMTNEEIIYCLSEPCLDDCFKCSKYGTDAYRFGDCREEVLKVASDIVQKYQKIKQILNDDSYYEEYGNNAETFIVSAISKVVEDGKT